MGAKVQGLQKNTPSTGTDCPVERAEALLQRARAGRDLAIKIARLTKELGSGREPMTWL